MGENSFENQFFKQAEQGVDSPEKFRAKFLEKAKNILGRLGVAWESAAGQEKETEIKEDLERIEPMKKGEEYDEEEEMMLLETSVEIGGREQTFKMVAQTDPNYQPEYKIDYEKEMPDYQKHAERMLKREAIIGQKLARFTDGQAVSADTIEDADTTPGRDMYLAKSTLENHRELSEFGREEGRMLAQTLLNLQYNVRSSEMINEIMGEQGYGNQYELENEFSEDIFNHFDGYLENSQAILEDRVEDGDITREEVGKVRKEMEKYRPIIEGRQMGEDEYSLVHNECFVDKLVAGKDGNMYLADWKNAGTTQNRELSLVSDLGQAFESARDHMDEEKAGEFMEGAREKLEEFYSREGAEQGKLLAEAVVSLAKLRVFQER